MDLGHKKYKHFHILSDHKWYSYILFEIQAIYTYLMCLCMDVDFSFFFSISIFAHIYIEVVCRVVTKLYYMSTFVWASKMIPERIYINCQRVWSGTTEKKG